MVGGWAWAIWMGAAQVGCTDTPGQSDRGSTALRSGMVEEGAGAADGVDAAGAFRGAPQGEGSVKSRLGVSVGGWQGSVTGGKV